MAIPIRPTNTVDQQYKQRVNAVNFFASGGSQATTGQSTTGNVGDQALYEKLNAMGNGELSPALYNKKFDMMA